MPVSLVIREMKTKTTVEYYLAIKKGTIGMCNNMNESQNNDAG